MASIGTAAENLAEYASQVIYSGSRQIRQSARVVIVARSGKISLVVFLTFI